jgi:asparagine synthase (glutamine-hydrolysing)
MFKLPPQSRIKGSTQKFLLKKASEAYLSKEIIYRPKAPFGSPLRSWIKGPLREMVDDLLSETALRARGLYNVAAVRRIIEADREGREDNALLIWTFLTTELWFRTFF